MRKILFLPAFLLASTSAFAQTAPIKVSQGSEYVSGWNKVVKFLYIQSTDNNLEIKKVVLNRGNCPLIMTGPNPPVTLRYGDTAKAIIDNCNLLETEIQTNKGTFTYK